MTGNEEYPTTPSSFVLNGFMYSLIGLYDLKETAGENSGKKRGPCMSVAWNPLKPCSPCMTLAQEPSTTSGTSCLALPPTWPAGTITPPTSINCSCLAPLMSPHLQRILSRGGKATLKAAGQSTTRAQNQKSYVSLCCTQKLDRGSLVSRA